MKKQVEEFWVTLMVHPPDAYGNRSIIVELFPVEVHTNQAELRDLYARWGLSAKVHAGAKVTRSTTSDVVEPLRTEELRVTTGNGTFLLENLVNRAPSSSYWVSGAFRLWAAEGRKAVGHIVCSFEHPKEDSWGWAGSVAWQGSPRPSVLVGGPIVALSQAKDAEFRLAYTPLPP
ncbi:MAG: hypothetical protein HYT80_05205 [Euryarchaeota archaeon]|nr:hypothetical protein [Euryarchaeota archaeon]